MTEFDTIKAGFECLEEDCRNIALIGFVDKEEIPENAIMAVFDDGIFDHEFQDLRTDSFDQCYFWGNIYLPFGYDDKYMKFHVNA